MCHAPPKRVKIKKSKEEQEPNCAGRKQPKRIWAASFMESGSPQIVVILGLELGWRGGFCLDFIKGQYERSEQGIKDQSGISVVETREERDHENSD